MSQRVKHIFKLTNAKFYIDADYQPGAMSYARGGGSYMDGNSYARGGNSYGRGGYGMYDMNGSYAQGGNSYMMYDPRYDYSMARGYSRTSKEEALSELQKMMGEVTDEKVKMALQEAITKMNK